MNSGSLGQLPNAPLAYLLAQVVIQPILSMEAEFIPKLQEALRDRFPRFKTIKQTMIAPGMDTPIQETSMWEFISPNGRIGVRVGQNMLMVHATEYTDYRAFENVMTGVLETFARVVPHTFTARMGMRYVDFIVPGEGESPEDYIISGIRCAPELNIGEALGFGFAMTEYDMPLGKLVVRYTRGKGSPALPEELMPLQLAPSPIMLSDVPENRVTGILDTDRIVFSEAPFDAVEVARMFDKMHRDLSSAFSAITTEHAKQVWKKQTQKEA